MSSFKQQDRKNLTRKSSEQCCVSMKSDQSMGVPVRFRDEDFSTDLRKRSKSLDSCSVSMKSDHSMGVPTTFRDGDFSTEHDRVKSANKAEQKIKSIFLELEEKCIILLKKELQRFKRLLTPDYPACSEREVEDEENQSEVSQEALQITLHVLRSMKQIDLANTLNNKFCPSCHQDLKKNLKAKFQKLHEGIPGHGSATLLNEIYTDLYITEGGSGEVNDEHEVRQIETASRRRATPETSIRCNDLFKKKSVRSVLTKGVAGIGKTVSVQKFILDWAEGKANQEVMFMFPLPFRELNLLVQKKFSLMELLQHFFPEVKGLKPRHHHQYRMLFIFDGLDECRFPLDFQSSVRVSDVTESASVDVLLTNLIKGNLLPSALIWITTRPAAANQIPAECVEQVTEVRGFSDPQKEEYFRKRFSNQSLANRVITHMKSSRSLHIMCHIPVFCWISASVLERMLTEAESGEIPKTLTQMFTHFLVFQIKHRNQKYDGKQEIDSEQTKHSITALGKLAFQQLEKGNLIFYEEDLRECDIDVREASVYSGVCTQIFREEFGLQQGKVFSFVHLSVQEFLAALYAFLCFTVKGKNVLQERSTGFRFLRQPTMFDFCKISVDKALQSENGHLDLFLRFLLGLSLESNQIVLRDLLPQRGSSSESRVKTVQYIKKKISENLSPEKSINLFHCLNELNDDSLVQEVQTYLKKGFSGASLSPAQWSALVFVLLNSEEELEEFDLSKYQRSEKWLLRMLPVVKASRKAQLCGCNLSEESCAALSSVLRSNSCRLKELDLSENKLQDSGVKLLSTGLKNPNCTLEILRLSDCWITEEGFAALVSALRSNPSSQLRELNLNQNKPEELAVNILSDLLEDKNCNLEKLELCGCNLREESCAALSSALSSNSCRLKELNLSYNNLQDSGVKLLSTGLQNPNCTLEILRLEHCRITEEGFAALVSALRLNPSSQLRELNLNLNKPGESGVKLLSDLLQDKNCHLEKLELCGCNLREESCAALSSVFRSNSSRLKELNLSYNKLQDSGVKLLSTGLQNPNCTLEILRLEHCRITEEGFAALVSALRLNPSSQLRELNLNQNAPGESGVKLLSDLLKDKNCNLEKLHFF